MDVRVLMDVHVVCWSWTIDQPHKVPTFHVLSLIPRITQYFSMQQWDQSSTRCWIMLDDFVDVSCFPRLTVAIKSVNNTQPRLVAPYLVKMGSCNISYRTAQNAKYTRDVLCAVTPENALAQQSNISWGQSGALLVLPEANLMSRQLDVAVGVSGRSVNRIEALSWITWQLDNQSYIYIYFINMYIYILVYMLNCPW